MNATVWKQQEACFAVVACIPASHSTTTTDKLRYPLCNCCLDSCDRRQHQCTGLTSRVIQEDVIRKPTDVLESRCNYENSFSTKPIYKMVAQSSVDINATNVRLFDFILFGIHHVHRITHESLIMTYFQCGPLMTCGGIEWEVESTTVTHSSADWWDLLLPLA